MPNFPSVYIELEELWKRLRRFEGNFSDLFRRIQCIDHIEDPTPSTLIQCDVRISGSINPNLYVGPNATDSGLYTDAELFVIGRTGDAYGSVTDGTSRAVIGSKNGTSYVGTQTNTNFKYYLFLLLK